MIPDERLEIKVAKWVSSETCTSLFEMPGGVIKTKSSTKN